MFALGIAESHTRSASQPWSPPYNPQSMYSSNPSQFNYPSDNLSTKWTTPDYQYNGASNRYSSPQQQQQQNFTDL